MTPPVSPTPTSPTEMLWRTTTQASLVLYSSASPVSSGTWLCFKSQNISRHSIYMNRFFFYLCPLSAGSLDETGQQVNFHHEFVFLFGVFDETESKYKPNGRANHVQYTINGYTMGSLPGESVQSFCYSLSHRVSRSFRYPWIYFKTWYAGDTSGRLRLNSS